MRDISGTIVEARRRYQKLAGDVGLTASTLARLGVPPTANTRQAVERIVSIIGDEAWTEARSIALDRNVLAASTFVIRAAAGRTTPKPQKPARPTRPAPTPGKEPPSDSFDDVEPADPCMNCYHSRTLHPEDGPCAMDACGCAGFVEMKDQKPSPVPKKPSPEANAPSGAFMKRCANFSTASQEQIKASHAAMMSGAFRPKRSKLNTSEKVERALSRDRIARAYGLDTEQLAACRKALEGKG